MITASDQSWMIQTGVPHIYDDLVDVKKLFLTRYELFVFGLVYGLLHNKVSTRKFCADMVKINTISNKIVKDIIDMVYMLLDDGRDKRDIKTQMFHIADGGVAALNDIYYNTHELDIFTMIKKAEQIWPVRIKDFNNV